jgi:hypothetical protein
MDRAMQVVYDLFIVYLFIKMYKRGAMTLDTLENHFIGTDYGQPTSGSLYFGKRYLLIYYLFILFIILVQ